MFEFSITYTPAEIAARRNINVKDEMPVDKAIKYKERLRMFSPRQKRNLFTHN